MTNEYSYVEEPYDEVTPFAHSWTCPSCRALHEWEWPEYDRPLPGDRIHFECEECSSATEMTWTGTAWKPD